MSDLKCSSRKQKANSAPNNPPFPPHRNKTPLGRNKSPRAKLHPSVYPQMPHFFRKTAGGALPSCTNYCRVISPCLSLDILRGGPNFTNYTRQAANLYLFDSVSPCPVAGEIWRRAAGGSPEREAELELGRPTWKKFKEAFRSPRKAITKS